MKLSDIVKGMLAPVVRVESGDNCLRVSTALGTVYTIDLHREPETLYRGTLGYAIGPWLIPKDTVTRIGDIGFAFWREPARKLRRVA